MKANPFLSLLIGILVLGASLGGAFAGGVALGKSQGDAPTQSVALGQPPLSPGEQFQGQPNQDELNQLRQQFQDQFGQGRVGGGGAFGDRGGLGGTIDEIEGNTLTISTPQGPLIVTIDGETTIQRIATGALGDLQVGTRVSVIGQRSEDGAVTAGSVVITPEGVTGFLGGASPGGGLRDGR